jgi:hypothetical protein
MVLLDLSQTRLRDAVAQKRRDGFAGGAAARNIGSGRGWRAVEVLCTASSDDASFEERHGGVSLSLVLEGSFQYRSDRGQALMRRGALSFGKRSWRRAEAPKAFQDRLDGVERTRWAAAASPVFTRPSFV